MPASHESSASSLGAVLLDRIVLTGTLGIEFLNIPVGYSQLYLECYLRGAQAVTDSNIRLRFNNDSGNNYTWSRLDSIGVTVAGTAGNAVAYVIAGRVVGASGTANYFTCLSVRLPNYTDLTNYKAFNSTYGGSRGTASTDVFSGIAGGLWLSATAINRILIWHDSGAGEYVSGSKASLYGLV